jgi:hypothetical protein
MDNKLLTYIDNELNNDKPLKIIMKAEVQNDDKDDKFGVVSIVIISKNKMKIKDTYLDLLEKDKEGYYFLYSCNLDEVLLDTEHFPSIRIDKEDLL